MFQERNCYRISNVSVSSSESPVCKVKALLQSDIVMIRYRILSSTRENRDFKVQ